MAKWHLDFYPAFDLVLRTSPVILYHPEYDPPIYWGGVVYYWLCFALVIDKTDQLRAEYVKLKEKIDGGA